MKRVCKRCGGELQGEERFCPNCDTLLTPGPPAGQDSLPVGYVLASYRVVRFIAAGGVADVYEAVHEGINKRVALKVLKAGLAVDRRVLQRFQGEAWALSWLRHPNIVGLVEAGHTGGRVFLALDYVDGGTLTDEVRRHGRLSLQRALPIVRAVAGALEHAWERGVVHRDIKPENILLTRRGRTKLADLGLAKLVGVHPSLTPTGSALGSPSYMAPEQTRDSKSVDTRADIYSLGVVWFFCLTGQRPFAAPRLVDVVARIRAEKLPDLDESVPGMPSWVRPCIEKMCAKSPKDRFADPSELLGYFASRSG